jgi:hypothetical protein
MSKLSNWEYGARRSRCVVFSLFLIASLFNLAWNAISFNIHATFATPSLVEPSYLEGPLGEFRSGGSIVGNHPTRHNSTWTTPTSKRTAEDMNLPSYPLRARKNSIRFLWGIESTDDELGMARRRLMRNTCLREFQTNQPDKRICSLLKLLVQRKNGGNSHEENLHNCSIVYTFFIVTNKDEKSNSHNASQTMTWKENAKYNDLLYLSNNRVVGRGGSSAVDSSFQVRTTPLLWKPLTWFHYATTNHQLTEHVQFEYIAKVDDDVILFPEWFHSMVQNVLPTHAALPLQTTNSALCGDTN